MWPRDLWKDSRERLLSGGPSAEQSLSLFDMQYGGKNKDQDPSALSLSVPSTPSFSIQLRPERVATGGRKAGRGQVASPALANLAKCSFSGLVHRKFWGKARARGTDLSRGHVLQATGLGFSLVFGKPI